MRTSLALMAAGFLMVSTSAHAQATQPRTGSREPGFRRVTATTWMKAAEVNCEKDVPSFEQQSQSGTTELRRFAAKTPPHPRPENRFAMLQGPQKKMATWSSRCPTPESPMRRG